MSKNTATNPELGSAFDLLGKSFEIVKKNWQAFVVVNILALLSAVLTFGDKKNVDIPKNANFEQVVKSLTGYDVGTFLSFFIPLAVVIIALSIYLFAMATILEVETTAGKKPSIGHLFDKAKGYWLRLLGLMIVIAILVIAGLILLIIPGLIAIIMLSMAPYFMVDKNMGIIESLKASFELSKKHFWVVFVAVFITLLVGLAGYFMANIPVVGALIGTIITIAFSLVVPLRYQQLKKLS